MNPIAAIRRRLRHADNAGFTLIELLVSMGIFAILCAAIMTTVFSVQHATKVTQETTDINQEARLATDRITRELRQASVLYAVYGTGGATGIEFGVDFNGVNGVEDFATDPEHLKYEAVPVGTSGEERIELTANDGGTMTTLPILAAQVYSFQLQYRSSLYLCDANGDGVTTWQELDSSLLAVCGGNQNGILDDELSKIDSVVMTFYVFNDSHRQDYRTQINLRNLEQS
jgi:prepilin-type N-terminal cleavage/methylation domain-containing protein